MNKPALKPLQNAIAACAFEFSTAGDRIQLFPAGKFRAVDGRPTDCAHWFIDAVVAKHLIAALSVRKNPIVIDYEHQALRTGENGMPAPAAGWMNGGKMVWEDGGFFADGVEWTSRARELIHNREYRYISPVFSYNRTTGAVNQIIHAALTNDPGLDGMSEVTLAAASRLAALTNTTETQTVNDELLILLRKLLGLPALITEKDSTIAALRVAIEAAKKKPAPTGKPDPAEYVPVAVLTKLTEQVAALSAQVNGGELDRVIAEALTAGKLLPALEPWARELGTNDLASLKSYVAAAAPIAALTTTQTGGKQPGSEAAHGLNAAELEVAELSGMTPEDFAAAKKEMEKHA